ncbi:MAG: hypothetical protein ACLUPV_02545 [Bilophila wadsworthia]
MPGNLRPARDSARNIRLRLPACGKRRCRAEPLAAFDGITTRNLLGPVFPPEARRSKSGTDADSGEENGRLSADGIDALPISKQGWKLLRTIVNTGPGESAAPSFR